VSAGELFGEISFFTEVPQLECIKAATVVRILTIPRAAYNGTAAAFPLGSRSVLDNLRVKAQQVGPRAYISWVLMRPPATLVDQTPARLVHCPGLLSAKHRPLNIDTAS
jgi:hypothetical protein